MTHPDRETRTWLRRDLLRGASAALVTASAAGCDLLSTRPDAGSVGQDDGRQPDVKGKQAPMLAERVKAGDLPPVKERLPTNPLVVDTVDGAGAYGGTWNSWLHGMGSLYMFVTQVGYENLVRWDPEWTTVIPNIAESWEVHEDGRAYVFHLREGMRWSDGEPFTADDLLFAYDEVLSDPDISPGGVPSIYKVERGPATLEKIDNHTIRFEFPSPSGLFLQRLATPEGRALTVPRHYLEQFHRSYNQDVEELAKDEGYDHWADLFSAKEDSWQWQNPDRPVLDAWVMVTPPGEDIDQAVFERNPYYWKVDSDGSQLPYLDSVSYPLVGDLEVALLKTTNGEIDLNYPHYAATVCTPANKPILARSRERAGYRFLEATSSTMNHMVIALNLTHKDEGLRDVFGNKDFRIGLSYAINRQEIVDTVFQQQGQPWQAAPRHDSDVYHERLATQYTDHDPGRANEHLDRAGYTERDDAGFRLRPDGKRISFAVDVATEMFELTRAMEMVKNDWEAVGIDIQAHTIDRTLFYDRKAGNLHDANVWTGDGGWGDVLLEPRWYFPFSAESNYAIPWATWYTSDGSDGEEPPAAAQQQMELYKQMLEAIDQDQQRDLFMQILDIAQEQFWVIGTVLDEAMYGTVKDTFHNVPDWMPGSWLYPSPGPTRPEQYWTSDR